MNNVKTLESEMQSVGVFAVIAAYYSRILEQTVNVEQAKSLVNAQCAFMALVMPIDLGYTYRIITLVWFVLSVLQCRIKLGAADEE